MTKAQEASCPGSPPPSLVALQEGLQLVADCWSLLDSIGGQSRRCLYLPQVSKVPKAAEIGATVTRALPGLWRGLPAEAQGYGGGWGHGRGWGAPVWCAADSGLEP